MLASVVATFRIMGLLMLIFPCLNVQSDPSPFREYVPLVWNGDRIVEDVNLKTKTHLDHLEHVLNYYRVPFKRISDTEIHIPEYIDDEVQWNFTSKANDPKWRKDHRVQDGFSIYTQNQGDLVAKN